MTKQIETDRVEFKAAGAVRKSRDQRTEEQKIEALRASMEEGKGA